MHTGCSEWFRQQDPTHVEQKVSLLFLRIIDYFLLRKYGGTKENDGSEGGKGESHDPYFSTVFHRLSVNNKLPSVFLSTYFTDNDGR